MNNHALHVLEYKQLLDYLSRYSESEITRTYIKSLVPSVKFREIRTWHDEVAEFVELIIHTDVTRMRIPGGLDKTLENAKIVGWVLQADKIFMVAVMIREFIKIRKILKSVDGCDCIKDIIEDVKIPIPLCEVIERSISESGEIMDHASKELSSIRREIRKVQDSIRSKLQSTAMDLHKQGHLQEPIVTFRNDRYVLPVKAGSLRALPGIVHDKSSTGITMFVEPQFIVAGNNRLTALKTDEIREEKRILKELSRKISEKVVELSVILEACIRLDLIQAKARFAIDTGGQRIALVKNAVFDIRKCINPLLKLHKLYQVSRDCPDVIVPIDVKISNEERILVITGPNTGGKTVALKTVGLSLMMVQSGIFPICSPDSEFGIFENIFADIGDEQSLQQSLSTFSAHLKQIINIFQYADGASLVLLDELGSGTDPTEGSALGIAILSEFLENKVAAIATTHHNSIKAFAFTTEGIANAAMEFDYQTLKPTYRILMDRIGQSNAFAIAKRLGMPNRILDSAKSQMQEQPADLEKMLLMVEKERKSAQKMKERANRERSRVRELRVARENVLQTACREAEEIRKKAVSDAAVLMTKIRQEKDHLVMERKEIKKLALKSRGEIENHLKEEDPGKRVQILDEDLQRLQQDVQLKSNRWSGPLPREGDSVKLIMMNSRSKVLKLHRDRTVTVDCKGKKLRVPLDGIQRMDDELKEKKAAVTISFPTENSDSETIPSRLNLIGHRVAEAVDKVEKYLDQAFRAGLPEVVIVHGFGTGRLQNAVVDILKRNPLVIAARRGTDAEGGGGVTVVELEKKRA